MYHEPAPGLTPRTGFSTLLPQMCQLTHLSQATASQLCMEATGRGLCCVGILRVSAHTQEGGDAGQGAQRRTLVLESALPNSAGLADGLELRRPNLQELSVLIPKAKRWCGRDGESLDPTD